MNFMKKFSAQASVQIPTGSIVEFKISVTLGPNPFYLTVFLTLREVEVLLSGYEEFIPC